MSASTAPPTDITPRVKEICAALKKALDTQPKLSVGNFDPINPDPSLLPAVGEHFAPSADFQAQAITELKALNAPVSARSDLDALITALEDEAANTRAQVLAAKNKQVDEFKATLPKADTLRSTTTKAAGAFDADGCAFA